MGCSLSDREKRRRKWSSSHSSRIIGSSFIGSKPLNCRLRHPRRCWDYAPQALFYALKTQFSSIFFKIKNIVSHAVAKSGVRAGTGARPYAGFHVVLLVSLLGRAQGPPLRCLHVALLVSLLGRAQGPPLRCLHVALLVSLLGRAQGPAPTLSPYGLVGFALRCPSYGLVGSPYAAPMWHCWYRC